MYLGIDQSLRSTGVAVVSTEERSMFTGTITPKKLLGVARLAYIRSGLRDILAGSLPITYAALEGYAVDAVNRSYDLGELGGVVRLVLHDAGIPFVVVAPKSLKMFVTSHGDAKKELMRQVVFKKWGIDIEQDDECDAFGLAQVARSFHLDVGTTRAQLEVIKKLKNTPKKIVLTASGSTAFSI